MVYQTYSNIPYPGPSHIRGHAGLTQIGFALPLDQSYWSVPPDRNYRALLFLFRGLHLDVVGFAPTRPLFLILLGMGIGTYSPRQALSPVLRILARCYSSRDPTRVDQ